MKGGFVILAQDTAAFNYNAHKSKKGLSPLFSKDTWGF
jgi:hypothetical protein